MKPRVEAAADAVGVPISMNTTAPLSWRHARQLMSKGRLGSDGNGLSGVSATRLRTLRRVVVNLLPWRAATARAPCLRCGLGQTVFSQPAA